METPVRRMLIPCCGTQWEGQGGSSETQSSVTFLGLPPSPLPSLIPAHTLPPSPAGVLLLEESGQAVSVTSIFLARSVFSPS